MVDHVEALVWQSPWLPSGAEMQHVYHRYNVPLVGVFQQNGTDYLFACRYGTGARLSVWMYVPVTLTDRTNLDAATREQFIQMLEEFEGRPESCYVIAHEGLGIVSSRPLRGPSSFAVAAEDTHQVLVAVDAPDLREELDELIAAFSE